MVEAVIIVGAVVVALAIWGVLVWVAKNHPDNHDGEWVS